MKNLYRGEVFYLIASPLDHVEAYRYFEDGGLAVVDGKIVEAGPFEAMRSRYPDFPVTDYSGKLITPGFIDSHIHFSQSEIQGMYGKQLLDWLDEYTFPAEEAISSMEYAQDIARFFVKETGEERNYDLCRLCHGSSCFRNRIIFRGYGV